MAPNIDQIQNVILKTGLHNTVDIDTEDKIRQCTYNMYKPYKSCLFLLPMQYRYLYIGCMLSMLHRILQRKWNYCPDLSPCPNTFSGFIVVSSLLLQTVPCRPITRICFSQIPWASSCITSVIHVLPKYAGNDSPSPSWRRRLIVNGTTMWCKYRIVEQDKQLKNMASTYCKMKNFHFRFIFAIWNNGDFQRGQKISNTVWS